MNHHLIVASLLLLFVSLIHSALGEVLVFSKLRSGSIVPTNAPAPLQERHVRIIWATWHIVSFCGAGFSILLYWLALPTTQVENTTILKVAIAAPMFTSSLLVFWATKGRHPGWIGLLIVSILISAS